MRNSARPFNDGWCPGARRRTAAVQERPLHAFQHRRAVTHQRGGWLSEALREPLRRLVPLHERAHVEFEAATTGVRRALWDRRCARHT
ncbi:unnamed protein product (plasmid) [Mycetohabitans rhizoxinica HKI 454]|uniref:Uncharacterized protein n=1 Tax=Mycetohabitans rhizoxinica (strain DSM 19002 / CIP 109453 / HKI 454) TaxID=882378 RepID=E5ATQ9_MYCRK|nr:unnamed protein product [Mycetohabitans rhizoxinica HKI 454]